MIQAAAAAPSRPFICIRPLMPTIPTSPASRKGTILPQHFILNSGPFNPGMTHVPVALVLQLKRKPLRTCLLTLSPALFHVLPADLTSHHSWDSLPFFLSTTSGAPRKADNTLDLSLPSLRAPQPSFISFSRDSCPFCYFLSQSPGALLLPSLRENPGHPPLLPSAFLGLP